jgi:hypothetical protein
MAHPKLIEIGTRFTRLTVIGLAPRISAHVRWYCQCDCGNITIVHGYSLRNGSTKSCRCLGDTQAIKHGHATTRGITKTYQAFCNMWTRCTNSNSDFWERYGGRGITVCERWQTFANFLEDMGESPLDRSLDRYPNPNGNYEKSNCRWATASEQQLNKQINRPTS